MRVAILTLHSQNFGNRLQNYALQQVLAREGMEVETLRRTKPAGPSASLKRVLRKVVKHDGTTQFLRFDDARIRFSCDAVVSETGFASPGLSDCYDAFVIGSDQVWNPHFAITGDSDFLPFVPSGKKLAYAASFGVSRIDGSARAHTAELLDGIPRISMREEAGSALVRSLTGRDAPVVLDPTMLLTPDEWRAAEERPSLVGVDGRPYCLKHVLGDDANAAAIDALAVGRGLAVVDLRDQSLPVGPAEFVWLVRNAALLCTDSFHGSVFATLFHVPFVIYERQGADSDMSSRFDTLCGTFGLERHRAGDPAFSLAGALDEDWARVDLRLAEERDRSLAWLRGALGEVEVVGSADGHAR